MRPVENYTFSNEKRIIKLYHSTMSDSFTVKRILSKKSHFYFWLPNGFVDMCSARGDVRYLHTITLTLVTNHH